MHFKHFCTLVLALSETVAALAVGKASNAIDVGESIGISDASEAAPALTERTAQAVVENDTGAPMYGVTLVHKYSDVYVNNATVSVLHPGETLKPPLTVNYHTGFMVTGYDWWLVTWVSEDGKTLYHTDPQNGQCWINKLAEVAPEIAGEVAGAIVKYVSEGSELAEKVAEWAVKNLMDTFLNKGDTCGFKQNYLTSADDGKQVKITIRKDGTAGISSPSGSSETVWDSAPLPK